MWITIDEGSSTFLTRISTVEFHCHLKVLSRKKNWDVLSFSVFSNFSGQNFFEDNEIFQECDERILKRFSNGVNIAFYFHVICIKDFWFSFIKNYGLSINILELFNHCLACD